MKLLFDENLSARLVALLQAEYPGSAHVEQLLGRGRAFLLGPPPKVVWLSVGNAGTDAIAALLKARAGNLERFDANPEEALIVIERV